MNICVYYFEKWIYKIFLEKTEPELDLNVKLENELNLLGLVHDQAVKSNLRNGNSWKKEVRLSNDLQSDIILILSPPAGAEIAGKVDDILAVPSRLPRRLLWLDAMTRPLSVSYFLLLRNSSPTVNVGLSKSILLSVSSREFYLFYFYWITL